MYPHNSSIIVFCQYDACVVHAFFPMSIRVTPDYLRLPTDYLRYAGMVLYLYHLYILLILFR